MQLHYNDTTIQITVDDNSYRYRTIMGENELTLYFSAPEFTEIQVGTYCVFEGETYTLMVPQNFKKKGTRDFEYTLIMHSDQALLSKYKFRDTGSNRLKFSLTATPAQHVQMLVDNLNQRDQGWTVGNLIGATEKVISYNHNYCSEALQMMAEAFETEWEIQGKTIHLKKLEYNAADPLALSYGKGNGFLPGVGRMNQANTKPVEILFVQGGSRNIDKSTYGSAELLLPKNQTMTYHGRTYQVDPEGLSIRRADKALATEEEASVDLSNIYPSRTGKVTGVVTVNAEKNLYDFIDNTIPAELNFENYLIAGETMTVIFQTGMLTGKEFDAKYIHGERRFELVPQEVDGQIMPNAQYIPEAENEYSIFGISLPPAYIRNDTDRTGASWEMFREGVKYLYEHEDDRFTFMGELDPIWAKTHWTSISSKIRLGGVVLFSDTQFQPTGVSIRITGIKDFINSPESPSIELSNIPVTGTVASDLRKISENEVATETKGKNITEFVKRRYNTLVDFTDDKLKADEIVRDESLDPRMLAHDSGTPQFSIQDAKVETNVDDDPSKLTIRAGKIMSHNFYALDRTGIQELKDNNQEYDPTRSWDIPETSVQFPDTDGYFIYLKVPLAEA